MISANGDESVGANHRASHGSRRQRRGHHGRGGSVPRQSARARRGHAVRSRLLVRRTSSTTMQTMSVVLEKPYILLYDKKITSMREIPAAVGEHHEEPARPLLVVAEDVSRRRLALLVVNNLRGVVPQRCGQSAGLRRPPQGIARRPCCSHRRQIDRRGGGANAREGDSRRSRAPPRACAITKDNTTIVDGAGNPIAIKARVRELRRQVEETSSDYDREKLEERVAKLAGGVAIVKSAPHPRSR